MQSFNVVEIWGAGGVPKIKLRGKPKGFSKIEGVYRYGFFLAEHLIQ